MTKPKSSPRKGKVERPEVWILHVKIGGQPWRPSYASIWRGDDDEAEEYAKECAKYLTQRRRKYKAVRYVPESR